MVTEVVRRNLSLVFHSKRDFLGATITPSLSIILPDLYIFITSMKRMLLKSI